VRQRLGHQGRRDLLPLLEGAIRAASLCDSTIKQIRDLLACGDTFLLGRYGRRCIPPSVILTLDNLKHFRDLERRLRIGSALTFNRSTIVSSIRSRSTSSACIARISSRYLVSSRSPGVGIRSVFMPLIRSSRASCASRLKLFRSHRHFQPRLDLHPLQIRSAFLS
jgi:hypothetical protein